MATKKKRAASAKARRSSSRRRTVRASSTALVDEQYPRSADLSSSSVIASPTRDNDKRVASRGTRFPFEQILGRLPNPDPTLKKFSGARRIGLYSLILEEFAVISGYCSQWVDHVLVTDRVIKAAKADRDEDQAIADAAAVRAQKAWARVRNRVIVMQKLLMGRFYGFSRAEKVWRFDEVVKEWIQDLYDVPWEAWNFDDRGRDYLVTSLNPLGALVDSSRFLHFQWGSADTKHGHGDLSEVYIALWHIQKIQEWGLQAVEDWSRLVAIVHMPRNFSPEDRAEAIEAVKEQYRFYVVVPSDETLVKIDTPNMNVTANGGAGRQEFAVIEFYERWIQIRLLGAPQTQAKGGAGNGKLDEVRKDIWEDKSPTGSAMLDQCLTEGWMNPYFDMNAPDVPMELRPRFESDASGVTQGLTGVAAQAATDVLMKLAAKQLTRLAAIELLAVIGMPRARATAVVDSTIAERDTLVIEATLPRGDTADPGGTPPADGSGAPTTDNNEQQQEAA